MVNPPKRRWLQPSPSEHYLNGTGSGDEIPRLGSLPLRKGEAKHARVSLRIRNVWLRARVILPLPGGERIEVRGELATPQTVKNRSARFSGFRFLPSL